jgi:predicted phage tail protein
MRPPASPNSSPTPPPPATGASTNQTSVVLKATGSDADAGDTVRLEVEVKPIGISFSNSATAQSSSVANGSTASATVTSLLDGTSYHWQARAVDNNGAASAWMSFGGNAETAADFIVDMSTPGAFTPTLTHATKPAVKDGDTVQFAGTLPESGLNKVSAVVRQFLDAAGTTQVGSDINVLSE